MSGCSQIRALLCDSFLFRVRSPSFPIHWELVEARRPFFSLVAIFGLARRWVVVPKLEVPASRENSTRRPSLIGIQPHRRQPSSPPQHHTPSTQSTWWPSCNRAVFETRLYCPSTHGDISVNGLSSPATSPRWRPRALPVEEQPPASSRLPTMSYPQITPARPVPGAFMNTPAPSRFQSNNDPPVQRRLFVNDGNAPAGPVNALSVARPGQGLPTNPPAAGSNVVALAPAPQPQQPVQDVPPVVKASQAVNRFLQSDQSFPELDAYARCTSASSRNPPHPP